MIDSGRWTGRGLRQGRAERHAARQAFHAAGGGGVKAPRRIATIVAVLGGLTLGLSLAVADGEGRLATDRQTIPVAWVNAFVGPALLVAIAAAMAGAASAWHHRAALVRGYAAAPVDRFETGGAGLAVCTLWVLLLPEDAARQRTALMLASWVMAAILARDLTLMVERLYGMPTVRRANATRLAFAMLVVTALLMLLFMR